ncbi:MAG: hypothetical protein VB857_11690, partial [Pirellulaceae bacterium]
MLTARTRLFHFVAIAAIVSLGFYGCNKPAETPNTPGPSSSGETETSSGHGLTAEAAQELLPAAASMSIADFEKLASAQTAGTWDTIKSKTLTFVLLTLNPQTASAENEAVLEDFNFPTGNALPQPSEITEVIYKSKTKGYATFLQPDLITHCTCQSDGDTASGFVTFSAPDLYAGKVQFIARRNEEKWQIEEFHLTNYGIKTVLGNDGNWHQSPLDTTDTSEEGSETNETSDTEEADEQSNTTEPDEASTATEPAAVAPVTDGTDHLTNLIARHLVCKAASMSNKDFKKFAGPDSNLDADEYA